ncbi:MAG TPA: hypothetical protein VFW52_03280, partial [Candidatus Saccharimonadales bacterium]|nr:hypothetical protein [Candidatus Saccharimonadales bacterium]
MSILEAAIGWIAPPCCIVCGIEGSALCATCTKEKIIPYGERCYGCGVVSRGSRTCERCRAGAPRHVWVGANYESAASNLVKVYKFKQLRPAAHSMAEIMARTYAKYCGLHIVDYLVVPVPTASGRIRNRGFDHADYLAAKIAKILGFKKINALARLGQSRQVGAERTV